jgi:hypothetical protein
MLFTTFNDIANSATLGKSKKGPAKQPTDKSAASLAENVKGLSVQESVKVKSKNLDVLAEYEKSQRKKAANFVVIGLLSYVWVTGDSSPANGYQGMWMLERAHLWVDCCTTSRRLMSGQWRSIGERPIR